MTVFFHVLMGAVWEPRTRENYLLVDTVDTLPFLDSDELKTLRGDGFLIMLRTIHVMGMNY